MPANRYAYYLTPKGFSEKSRLTAEYLKSSFSFYRRAKYDLTKIMEFCSKKKLFNIVLSDESELAEIAIIISLLAIVILIETFKTQLYVVIPNIDLYILNLKQTLIVIFLFFKDLIK